MPDVCILCKMVSPSHDGVWVSFAGTFFAALGVVRTGCMRDVCLLCKMVFPSQDGVWVSFAGTVFGFHLLGYSLRRSEWDFNGVSHLPTSGPCYLDHIS